MKKIALVLYPEFSLQEVSTLMYIFRWFYDSKTVTFSSSHELVYAEEGIGIYPEKTFDEFHKDDYYCLILPGCSDFTEAFKNIALFKFLHTFKNEHKFVIGAICSAPIFLSMAGLLENKKFTNSVAMEVSEQFLAIEENNLVFAPIVVDENIVTAVGDAFREFAIEIARQVGFECRDEAMSGIAKHWKAIDFEHHIPSDEIDVFMNHELPKFESAYANIKNNL